MLVFPASNGAAAGVATLRVIPGWVRRARRARLTLVGGHALVCSADIALATADARVVDYAGLPSWTILAHFTMVNHVLNANGAIATGIATSSIILESVSLAFRAGHAHVI
jgi:hypothetical protein